MTLEEFSNEFDVLLNDKISRLPFGIVEGPRTFTEYEKSVFLTLSQEEIVLSYYSGINALKLGFEANEEVREYLAPLVKTLTLHPNSVTSLGKFTKNTFYPLNNKIWFIVSDYILDEKNCRGMIEVVPTTLDDLVRVLQNPFKRPNDRRALRILHSKKSEELVDFGLEVIYTKSLQDTGYTINYLKKPNPIILENLGSLKIDGESSPSQCEVHSALHRIILDRAVTKALNQSVGNKTE